MLEMAQNLQEARLSHSYDDILNDRILFYGLTKMTEILGEAAYKITLEFRNTHQDLPWKEIIGMRHLLVHGYFSISPEVLWNVIQNDIPDIIPILKKYLGQKGV